MQKENQEFFKCPECDSETIRFRFKVNSKNQNRAYANVTEEIQCAKCFMDIPANIFIIYDENDFEKMSPHSSPLVIRTDPAFF